jgi:hypothetical protein
MPMQEASAFGTEADGSKAEEYCHLCYQDGAFTSDVTMEQMVDISARGMSEAMGTPEAQAQEMLRGILPNLKRWQTAA